MKENEAYEAWTRARAEADVPPDFADGVMQAVQHAQMRPGPGPVRRAARPRRGGVVDFALAVLLAPPRAVAWCGRVLWQSATALVRPRRGRDQERTTSKRLLRVDLAPNAADFQALAVEPGLPMLDPQAVHYALLRKWLGSFVAEPEWNGTAVHFYVRDDHGNRLMEVESRPAEADELSGRLRSEWSAIVDKLNAAHPESDTEVLLHRLVSRLVRELHDDPREDFGCHVVRYREPLGRWHLALCWGFRRADQQPLRPMICPHEPCRQLFVVRGDPAVCPACRQAHPAK